MNWASRADGDARVGSGGDGYAGDNVHIEETFVDENFTDGVVVFGPAKFESVGDAIALGICGGERVHCLRLAPRASARLVFFAALSGKNVNAAAVGVFEFH